MKWTPRSPGLHSCSFMSCLLVLVSFFSLAVCYSHLFRFASCHSNFIPLVMKGHFAAHVPHTICSVLVAIVQTRWRLQGQRPLPVSKKWWIIPAECNPMRWQGPKLTTAPPSSSAGRCPLIETSDLLITTTTTTTNRPAWLATQFNQHEVHRIHPHLEVLLPGVHPSHTLFGA